MLLKKLFSVIILTAFFLPAFVFCQQTAKDKLGAEMFKIASRAQQYYKKPTSLGGGGNSFIDFNLSKEQLASKNGTITSEIKNNTLILTGIPKNSKGAAGDVIKIIVDNTGVKVLGLEELIIESAINSNRDAVISDMTSVATMAQTYYKKPAALGGGGKSFTGFVIPTNMADNSNGKITAKVEKDRVELIGTGVEKAGAKNLPVSVHMIVGPDKILATTIIN